mmetsp:Transcript_42308/g.68608  ORF Transcript_42308/g.68608 Transcript_42308/m.68608 type:complete len:453 (+) Transcript_42308:27-1385(+)
MDDNTYNYKFSYSTDEERYRPNFEWSSHKFTYEDFLNPSLLYIPCIAAILSMLFDAACNTAADAAAVNDAVQRKGKSYVVNTHRFLLFVGVLCVGSYAFRNGSNVSKETLFALGLPFLLRFVALTFILAAQGYWGLAEELLELLAPVLSISFIQLGVFIWWTIPLTIIGWVSAFVLAHFTYVHLSPITVLLTSQLEFVLNIQEFIRKIDFEALAFGVKYHLIKAAVEQPEVIFGVLALYTIFLYGRYKKRRSIYSTVLVAVFAFYRNFPAFAPSFVFLMLGNGIIGVLSNPKRFMGLSFLLPDPFYAILWWVTFTGPLGSSLSKEGMGWFVDFYVAKLVLFKIFGRAKYTSKRFWFKCILLGLLVTFVVKVKFNFEEIVDETERVFNQDRWVQKILDVPEGATQEEIKKACRAKRLQWHPDKHMHETEDQIAKATEMFRKVQTACQQLRTAQ